MIKKFLFVLILFVVVVFSSCSERGKKNEVIIYTSLDQVFSEPILKKFEKETGIKVRIVYDIEATKTTGLVNRLIAEKNNPQADVFWNSEIARTIMLKNKGILTPYFSKQAEDIPEKYKDPDGYWTGFAARARVLIYNKKMLDLESIPDSIFELTNATWMGKVALAYPLFGTTSTHAAALFVSLGEEKAEKFFRKLKENNIVIVDGNSTARDVVQNGEVPLGFTDTDDAYISIINKKDVGIIFPDQGEDQIGALLIPNTVCLIKGSPNPEKAKKLIDYILSKQTESALAFTDGAQIPLRGDVKRPDTMVSIKNIKTMDVDFQKVAEQIEGTSKVLQNIFIR